MRLDALIIFFIEWPHQVLILRGKLSKYWSKKKHEKTKHMRLDALIISLLNDHSQCLFGGVNSRNTEANIKIKQ